MSLAVVTERQLKDKAAALLAKGALERALEIFRQLICMNGKEPAYRLRHAEVSVRLGRPQVAVGSFRVAAHLLGEEGRLAQARAALNRAIELAPRDASLRRMARDLAPARELPPPSFFDGEEPPTEPCLVPVFDS